MAFCWLVLTCRGGTTVTVTGENVDASAQPFIMVTVVVNRANSNHDDDDDQITVTSEVRCRLTLCQSTTLPTSKNLSSAIDMNTT